MKCNLKKENLIIAHEVMKFLEKNYQDRLDYGYLVIKFQINEYKLKLAFKEVARDNIHAFLTKIRMEQGMRLLESTDFQIKFIAHKVGLDKSNFNQLADRFNMAVEFSIGQRLIVFLKPVF